MAKATGSNRRRFFPELVCSVIVGKSQTRTIAQWGWPGDFETKAAAPVTPGSIAKQMRACVIAGRLGQPTAAKSTETGFCHTCVKSQASPRPVTNRCYTLNPWFTWPNRIFPEFCHCNTPCRKPRHTYGGPPLPLYPWIYIYFKLVLHRYKWYYSPMISTL